MWRGYGYIMSKFGTAVILAGGKSTRMGFDKQFLLVNEMRLIDKLITELEGEFKEIIIVSNTPKYYSSKGIKVVSDRIVGMGPLSGVHVGLTESTNDYVYFLACDMPNVCTDYIRYMKSEIQNSQIDACVTRIKEWIEPFNAFYSKSIVNEIESNLRNEKGSIFYLLKKLNCLYIEEKEARKYSPDWSMFINLNTKDDLDNYLNYFKK